MYVNMFAKFDDIIMKNTNEKYFTIFPYSEF